MPRGYIRSSSTTSRLRVYFGIEQPELALFLGVSEGMIGHFDTGRRPLDYTRRAWLLPLIAHLPATPPEQFIDEAMVVAEPAPPPPAAVLPALVARRRYCLGTAARLRREVAPLVKKARYAARWQAALPALLASLPAPDAPVIDTDPDYIWARHWFAKRARPLADRDLTKWHLLCARADGLEAEAAALTVIIAAGTTP